MYPPTARLFLRLLLAWSVALAPMLPAFASATNGADGHAAHAGAHAKTAATDTDAPSSAAHENCNDHCCLACTMHFISIVAPAGEGVYARAIQIPVVQRHHSHAVITPPDRPPRLSS